MTSTRSGRVAQDVAEQLAGDAASPAPGDLLRQTARAQGLSDLAPRVGGGTGPRDVERPAAHASAGADVREPVIEGGDQDRDVVVCGRRAQDGLAQPACGRRSGRRIGQCGSETRLGGDRVALVLDQAVGVEDRDRARREERCAAHAALRERIGQPQRKAVGEQRADCPVGFTHEGRRVPRRRVPQREVDRIDDADPRGRVPTFFVCLQSDPRRRATAPDRD